jgi:hypothetical protein
MSDEWPCQGSWDHTNMKEGLYRVDCGCTVRWGRAWRVFTPCCQGARQGVRDGDLILCPDCEWYWNVHFNSTGTYTRWYSEGYGLQRRETGYALRIHKA